MRNSKIQHYENIAADSGGPLSVSIVYGLAESASRLQYPTIALRFGFPQVKAYPSILRVTSETLNS